MRVKITDTVAAKLLDRLKDEQPGGPLDGLRKDLEAATSPERNRVRQLTADELTITLAAVQDLAYKFRRIGNPTEQQVGQLGQLNAAEGKLTVMLQRTRDREQETAGADGDD
jgi:hypothetical protein